MTGAEATLIKGGAMVASGGLVADLIIFNDPMYGALALSGALVSSFGVIHEISENKERHTKLTIAGELIKGFTLGFIAIPFWYLILSGLGNEVIARNIDMSNSIKIERSVWLLLSFWLAWFTVPIVNFFVDTSKIFGKKIKKRARDDESE